MSPETLSDNGECEAANGTRYSNKFEGIIPKVIRKFYDRRVGIKKEMLVAKQEYEKNPSKKLAIKIDTLDTEQTGIKILMNSLYGSSRTNGFVTLTIVLQKVSHCPVSVRYVALRRR